MNYVISGHDLVSQGRLLLIWWNKLLISTHRLIIWGYKWLICVHKWQRKSNPDRWLASWKQNCLDKTISTQGLLIRSGSGAFNLVSQPSSWICRCSISCVWNHSLFTIKCAISTFCHFCMCQCLKSKCEMYPLYRAFKNMKHFYRGENYTSPVSDDAKWW